MDASLPLQSYSRSDHPEDPILVYSSSQPAQGRAMSHRTFCMSAAYAISANASQDWLGADHSSKNT